MKHFGKITIAVVQTTSKFNNGADCHATSASGTGLPIEIALAGASLLSPFAALIFTAKHKKHYSVKLLAKVS